jgi:putative Ca2+/H+ antiporter (TMEM165/GDT1 family)
LQVALVVGATSGDVAGNVVSEQVLRWIAGLGFVAIGIWTLLRGG